MCAIRSGCNGSRPKSRWRLRPTNLLRSLTCAAATASAPIQSFFTPSDIYHRRTEGRSSLNELHAALSLFLQPQTRICQLNHPLLRVRSTLRHRPSVRAHSAAVQFRDVRNSGAASHRRSLGFADNNLGTREQLRVKGPFLRSFVRSFRGSKSSSLVAARDVRKGKEKGRRRTTINRT